MNWPASWSGPITLLVISAVLPEYLHRPQVCSLKENVHKKIRVMDLISECIKINVRAGLLSSTFSPEIGLNFFIRKCAVQNYTHKLREGWLLLNLLPVRKTPIEYKNIYYITHQGSH